uniref:Globoside alpha-1,3-N-acetylgalactosaminyltransferase 1, like 4 n=1 Tax=Sparus aurata TaxID=8175 RepID=A0A671V6G9_SPAAU
MRVTASTWWLLTSEYIHHLYHHRANNANRANKLFVIRVVTRDLLVFQSAVQTADRSDVVSVTPWLAPVVWEGTFNPVLLDSIYEPQNISVAVTVFAVGKYIMFLKNFLETAEQHFFIGFNVHVYVFTDRTKDVPQVKMAAGRQLTVRSVPSSKRWQEISARRMELIQLLIEEELHHTDYIFCLDVDSKFHGRWGSESLGGLVAVIHPGYYKDDRSRFPYERRPESRAYLAPGEGDFYYCGGGSPEQVLSPEYLWQDFKSREPEIHIIRFSGVVKNYADIRPNV